MRRRPRPTRGLSRQERERERNVFFILCFVDLASRYIRVTKTNLMHYLSSVYFINRPLYVSGNLRTNLLHFLKFTFMLPCIVIDFFLDNQSDALIIPILLCYKTLHVFGHLLCPSPGVLYCTFATGKFHAVF